MVKLTDFTCYNLDMKSELIWAVVIIFVVLPVVAFFYAPLHDLSGAPFLISSAGVVLLCLLLIASQKRVDKNQKTIAEIQAKLQRTNETIDSLRRASRTIEETRV